MAAGRTDCVLGFMDEVWWSRLAQPAMHAWAPGGDPLRLAGHKAEKGDPDPKAIACYGLLRRDTDAGGKPRDEMLLRFVRGRPVSHVTCDFLSWACGELAGEGKKVLLLVWDNAAWHVSREVKGWIKAHNRQAKQGGGVRIRVCHLPVKAPWLNPIEPKWVHGKRAVAEPDRKLAAQELKRRICDYYGCEDLPPLAQKVA